MLKMIGIKCKQLLNMIMQKYNKLHIEPYLVSINWLLFIFSWFIYFNLIPSGVVTLVLISTIPILGILLPFLLSAIYRYFWGAQTTNSADTNASTISTEHDDIHNACAKFTLHSFIHINILYCTLKTFTMTYAFSSTGICGIVLSSCIALLMLPIVLKEITALITVLKNGGGTRNPQKNKQHHLNAYNLSISLLVAAMVSILVFAVMITSTIFLPTIFPMIYMPLLFITTLVTLDFLVLVTYLHYIRLQYGDENLNWSRVTMNILTFITGTFGLLLTIFKLSAKASMFAPHSMVFSGIFTSVLGASSFMLFPTLIIFGLGVTGVLINNPLKQTAPVGITRSMSADSLLAQKTASVSIPRSVSADSLSPKPQGS
jgi:hypothetical protein